MQRPNTRTRFSKDFRTDSCETTGEFHGKIRNCAGRDRRRYVTNVTARAHEPGERIFTRLKSVEGPRSRAADNRSGPTMFVRSACLQRSTAAKRLSTFDNRRIYRSICAGRVRRSNSRGSRLAKRDETKRNETRQEGTLLTRRDPHTAQREKEREREEEERSVGERADSSSLIARHVALLGDTFRQIHSRPASATFLRETLETRPRVTAPRERERKLEALCPPQRTGSSEKIVEIYSSQCWTLTESIAVDCFEDRADHRSPATLGPHNW